MPWISRKQLREERERDRQLILQIVADHKALALEMMKMQREFMDLFHVTEPPTSHTIRDEDEWAAEQERTREAQWKLFGERES